MLLLLGQYALPAAGSHSCFAPSAPGCLAPVTDVTRTFLMPWQLDIDNAAVEQALMKQIDADAALQAMISEIFFEQHFTDRTVRASTSKGASTRADAAACAGFHSVQHS